MATSKQAEMVLAGEFGDDNIDDISMMILQNMKQKTPETVDAYITKEDFVGKMKVWRESTSTSPGSKRHLGHYKALLTPPPSGLTKDEKEEWKRRQDNILDCYVLVINCCIKYKYVLERWKKVTNMMIYKEEGNVKIH